MKKNEGKAETVLSEETKPLRYTDFVKPNPFIKPWMEPYFPTNCYLRDLIVAGVGTGAGFLVAISFYVTMGKFGAVLGGLIFLAFIVIFQGDVRGRYLAATAKFFMEKNNANNSKTK